MISTPLFYKYELLADYLLYRIFMHVGIFCQPLFFFYIG